MRGAAVDYKTQLSLLGNMDSSNADAAASVAASKQDEKQPGHDQEKQNEKEETSEQTQEVEEEEEEEDDISCGILLFELCMCWFLCRTDFTFVAMM